MKIIPFGIVNVTKQDQVIVSCPKATITLFHGRTQCTMACCRTLVLWLPQVKGIANVLSRYIKIKLIHLAFWSRQSLRAFLTTSMKTDGIISPFLNSWQVTWYFKTRLLDNFEFLYLSACFIVVILCLTVTFQNKAQIAY